MHLLVLQGTVVVVVVAVGSAVSVVIRIVVYRGIVADKVMDSSAVDMKQEEIH